MTDLQRPRWRALAAAVLLTLPALVPADRTGMAPSRDHPAGVVDELEGRSPSAGSIPEPEDRRPVESGSRPGEVNRSVPSSESAGDPRATGRRTSRPSSAKAASRSSAQASSREAAAALSRDGDRDSIQDHLDNCLEIFNPDQADLDGDGIGDLCDWDLDGDGIPNSLDNCPFAPNPSQYDMNGDGVGDGCDLDIDGDGIMNWEDEHPTDPRSNSEIISSRARLASKLEDALRGSPLAYWATPAPPEVDGGWPLMTRGVQPDRTPAPPNAAWRMAPSRDLADPIATPSSSVPGFLQGLVPVSARRDG